MGSHCNRLQTWPLRTWFLLEFVKWASDGKGSGSWLQNCLFCLEASDMGEWNGVEQPSNEFPNATTRVPCQMAQTTPSLVKRTKTCCKAARNFSAHDLVFNCKITLLSQVHVQTASHTYVIIYIYTHTHMHKHIHFTHTWNCPRCAKILKHVEGNGTQQENWTGNCGSTATKKINFMVERAAEWGPKYCRGHEHSVRTDQQHLSRCIKMSALLQFAGIRWHILAYISHHQSIEVSDIQNICPHDACGWPRWLDFFSF